MSWRERWESRKANAVVGAVQPRVLTSEEEAHKAQQQQDFRLGVRIGLGVLAGIAVANTINGAASGPDGWALAKLYNDNGWQS